MSDTLDAVNSTEPHAAWGLFRIAAFILGLAAGWRYIPAPIFDIPLIRVVAFLAPAAFALILADLARALWVMHRGPQSMAEQFAVMSLQLIVVLLALTILGPLARVYNRVQTLKTYRWRTSDDGGDR